MPNARHRLKDRPSLSLSDVTNGSQGLNPAPAHGNSWDTVSEDRRVSFVGPTGGSSDTTVAAKIALWEQKGEDDLHLPRMEKYPSWARPLQQSHTLLPIANSPPRTISSSAGDASARQTKRPVTSTENSNLISELSLSLPSFDPDLQPNLLRPLKIYRDIKGIRIHRDVLIWLRCIRSEVTMESLSCAKIASCLKGRAQAWYAQKCKLDPSAVATPFHLLHALKEEFKLKAVSAEMMKHTFPALGVYSELEVQDYVKLFLVLGAHKGWPASLALKKVWIMLPWRLRARVRVVATASGEMEKFMNGLNEEIRELRKRKMKRREVKDGRSVGDTESVSQSATRGLRLAETVWNDNGRKRRLDLTKGVVEQGICGPKEVLSKYQNTASRTSLEYHFEEGDSISRKQRRFSPRIISTPSTRTALVSQISPTGRKRAFSTLGEAGKSRTSLSGFLPLTSPPPVPTKQVMTSDQPQRVVSTAKAKRHGETPIASPSILHFQKPICQATASTQQRQLTTDSFFKPIPKPSQLAPSVPRRPHTQPPAAAAAEVHPSLSSRALTLNSAQPASPRRRRFLSFLPSSSQTQQSLPASSFCPSPSSPTSSRPSIFTSSPQIQRQQPVSLSRTQQQPPSTSRPSPQTQHQQPASLSPCQPQSPTSSTSLGMAPHHQPHFQPHQPSNTCTTPVTRKSVLELGGLIPMTAKLDFWALKSPELARDIWLPLSDGGSGGSSDEEEQEEEAKLEENRLRILGQMGLVPLVSGKWFGAGR